MTTRPCPGPVPGIPCTSGPNGSTALVHAKPGSKQAARCGYCSTIHERQRGTTTQRGYGPDHKRLRAQAIATYSPYDLCWRCGQSLGPDPTVLDLGHTDDRLGYMGLEHMACNRGRR